MRIRTSPTDIENLRYYRRVDDPDLDRLLEQMRREEAPGPKMEAGNALHKWLEHSNIVDTDGLVVESMGYTFKFETSGQVYVPPAREIYTRVSYEVGGDVYDVGMKVDSVDALTVYDHKLTGKFDPEAYYLDSMQWRIYLDAFDAPRFVYNVFVGSGRGKKWTIRDFHEIEFFRYQGMREEIEAALEDFGAFAKAYLPERCRD